MGPTRCLVFLFQWFKVTCCQVIKVLNSKPNIPGLNPACRWNTSSPLRGQPTPKAGLEVIRNTLYSESLWLPTYHVCIIRLPCVRHMVTMCASYGYHVCVIWLPCVRHMVTMCASYGYHVCVIRLPCVRHTVTMCASYGYHVCVIWLPCVHHMVTICASSSFFCVQGREAINRTTTLYTCIE